MSALKSEDITMLVDVRQIAASRRRGFSKTALRDHLGSEGIDYLHLRALGDPKPGRVAAREGRFEDFMTIYSNHLATAEALEALNHLAGLVEKQRICLLCYE